jgi:GNAT superfamily N-acetyltransferase
MKGIEYCAPGVGDRDALRAMARQCFAETFAHLYDKEPFDNFLAGAYGSRGRMALDLVDPDVRWLAAMHGGQPIGYAKVTPLRAPAPAPLPGSAELQQIYVAAPWQGCGAGDRLMQWALDTAQEQEAPEIYLTVFDHNERAKRLYSKYGFAEVGRCTFVIGERVDDDRIWRRNFVVC